VPELHRWTGTGGLCYCDTVEDITVFCPDDVYRRARIRAAERNTSVSALVRDLLSQVGEQDESEPAGTIDGDHRRDPESQPEFHPRRSLEPEDYTIESASSTEHPIYAIASIARPEEAEQARRIRRKRPRYSFRAPGVLCPGNSDSRRDRISHEEAVAFIQALCEFPVQELTVSVLQSALPAASLSDFLLGCGDHRAHGTSAAKFLARIGRCGTMAGIRVVNPFRLIERLELSTLRKLAGAFGFGARARYRRTNNL